MRLHCSVLETIVFVLQCTAVVNFNVRGPKFVALYITFTLKNYSRIYRDTKTEFF